MQEQTRTTTKFNIFDIFVILFLVFVLAVVIKFAFFGKEAQWVYVEFETKAMPSWLAQQISIGDAEYVRGVMLANLTDVYHYATSNIEHKALIRAKLRVEEKDDKLFFKSGELRVGGTIQIKTEQLTLDGLISKIDLVEESSIKRNAVLTYVTFIARNQPIRITEALANAGIEKNNKGQTLAEIFDFTTFEGDEEGDVIIDAKILVEDVNGELFFKNSPIKAKAPIFLNLQNVVLEGEVLAVNDQRRNLSNKTIVDIRITNVPLEVIKAIETNDVMTSYLGEEIARIIDFETSPLPGVNKNVFMTVALQTRKIGNDLYFLDERLKLGSTLHIITQQIDLSGKVVTIHPQSKKLVEKEILLGVYNVAPWVAESINIGDKELNNEKRVTAEIINKDIRPAKMVVITDSGEVYEKQNPINRDIILTVKIWSEDVGSDLLFHNNKVKIDEEILLDLTSIDLQGKIIGFAE
ncbi:DUF4330 family protein [Candidatus Woesearchaeota archaeon]|nr:DUF4330 family protein [Candidatus Woesearchaeota archaeon]